MGDLTTFCLFSRNSCLNLNIFRNQFSQALRKWPDQTGSLTAKRVAVRFSKPTRGAPSTLVYTFMNRSTSRKQARCCKPAAPFPSSALCAWTPRVDCSSSLSVPFITSALLSYLAGVAFVIYAARSAGVRWGYIFFKTFVWTDGCMKVDSSCLMLA
ncbi:hypothetical protein M438DRAFT_94532 [Aureobasidium pullulans EXF-150]|uniref:Uncharacterized protein n=1 Tax=Aureobasidium pullulans EXF-150 TaxID=1043002 RepID=A0A074XTL3_AURPU|nr:uncharacterized protein M438DRAFT_94532 [Aureobasidium pullulans EXF-150]KEQ88938.1 hypothetical protein M438DRAFT_94532 [Aureobasidium pullulans EXF-150]